MKSEFIEKKISCPNCKHEFYIKGKPNQSLTLNCPNCNTFGKFTFPADKTKSKTVDCFTELGEECFSRLRKFNAIMGLFHFIQGSLMLILSNNFTLPLKYTTPEFNATTQTIISCGYFYRCPYWSISGTLSIHVCNCTFSNCICSLSVVREKTEETYESSKMD